VCAKTLQQHGGVLALAALRLRRAKPLPACCDVG